MKVVERRHGGELSVHGRRAPRRRTAGQDDDVLGRAAQPAREIPQLLDAEIRPLIATQAHELPELAQIARVCADRVRRALRVRQPPKERLNRLNRPTIRADHRPRHAVALHDPLNPTAAIRSQHQNPR
jgi:hypothetical protein